MRYLYTPSASVHWSWVTLAGPDAADFLQRVTTVDTRILGPGQGAPGCLLTGQGKVRAVFMLWNRGDSTYAFEFDAGATGAWKTSLLDALEQLHFAEKFEVKDASTGLACRWVFGPEWADAPPPGTTLSWGAVRVLHHGSEDFGRPWLTLWGPGDEVDRFLAEKTGSLQSIDRSEWEGWRVAALTPWIDSEIDSSTIPLEVGLERAVSQNKGCYPGQEVIERIRTYGSPARRLCKLEFSPATVIPGDPVLSRSEDPSVAPVEIGRITSVAGSLALGLIKKLHLKEGAEIQAGAGRGRILLCVPPQSTRSNPKPS